MSKHLKPCPFCGGKNIKMQKPFEGFFVLCTMCGTTTPPTNTAEGAFNRWNKRAAAPDLLVAEVKRWLDKLYSDLPPPEGGISILDIMDMNKILEELE